MGDSGANTGNSPDLPPALAAREQWIAWRNECRECSTVLDPETKVCPHCDEKTTKRPIDPHTGGFAKASAGDMSEARETWADIETAVEFHEENDTHGIGFVFDEDGPVAGVDFDDVRDPETGEIEEWVVGEVRRLNSYTEVSPSETGLHTYVFGELPEGGNRADNIEIYDKERYFTVTGDEIPQSPGSVNYRQDELASIQAGRVETSSGGDIEEADLDFDVASIVGDFDGQDVYENDLGETLEEHREQDDKLDAALEELEPGYDTPSGNNSTSEYDISVVSKLWKRRFSAEQITKILFQYRYRPKLERPSYLEPTIAKGVGGERFDPRNIDDITILDNRTQYRSVDEVRWPDGHFVLDKPPREGGSHASMDELSDRSLVVLASRHSIAKHHLEILSDVMPEGATAVHFVGGQRACEHSSGGSCPKAVTEYEDLLELQHEVMDAVQENRTLTYEDAPERFCNKQFVSEAAKVAHTVVTVPNLLTKIDRDFSDHNLLIDEEQALGYFRTPSVDIATITTVYDPDGTRRVQASSSNISSELDTLDEIRQTIREQQQERADDGDTDQFHETAREKDVINAIEYLEEIADTMAIEELSEEMENPTAGDMVRELREKLSDIPSPAPNLTPSNFRSKVEEYVERYYFDDSVSPGAMIEAALFGYDNRKFDFKHTMDGYKLRMIGGRHVFHIDTLFQFDRIGVIAGPEGELLFDDLGLGEDTEVIDITEFEYADDFVILPVGRERENRMEPPSSQRKRARAVSKILNERAHPHMAVAGTKSRAKAHHSSLDKGPADIISSPKSPAKDIFATWSVGGSAIIYENSAVSRGIDAPAFDISVVVSSGFATPYWEARKAHYRGEDSEEYKYAESIEAQLKSHELTNAVLRPAPTRHIDEYTGTKFIVSADWDAPRIQYVEQETPTFALAESAANFLQNLTIGGGLRKDIDDVYWELDGHEGKFIQAAMDGQFMEVEQDRPSYTVGELEEWVENRYFNTERTVERVEREAPWYKVEIRTDEIVDLFTKWNPARVKKALDVLERMGVIESYQKSDGSKGRPPTIWKRRSLSGEDG